MRRNVTTEEQFARLLEIHSPAAAAAADPRLATLTDLANALRSAGQSPDLPAPDPAFRAALRQRLVAVATVQPAETPVRRPSRYGALAGARYRFQRRVAALAGTVMVATSVAGVGVAAAKSLPGDPFYGVKRATEDVQLWMTFGTEAKGRRHLEFAQTRLDEARQLPPASSHLASTLSAMDAETKAGSSDLISAYRTSHSTQPIADLVRFSRDQITGLTQLATSLPAGQRLHELTSISLLTGVVQHVHDVAKGVCLSCLLHNGAPSPVPVPAPTSPSAHPSKHPSSHKTGHHHGQQSGKPGGNGATAAPGHSSSPKPKSSPTPTKSPLLPLPIPLPTLSSILHPKTQTSPLPLVSTLLGDLGL